MAVIRENPSGIDLLFEDGSSVTVDVGNVGEVKLLLERGFSDSILEHHVRAMNGRPIRAIIHLTCVYRSDEPIGRVEGYSTLRDWYKCEAGVVSRQQHAGRNPGIVCACECGIGKCAQYISRVAPEED